MMVVTITVSRNDHKDNDDNNDDGNVDRLTIILK